jgi:Copper amine oxidase, enzyme domain
MRLRLVCLIVLLGLALPVHAQRTIPAESASPQMVADALKQLDALFSVDDWKYSVELKDRPFKLYRLDNGKRLLLKATIKAQPSLEVLNSYNEKTAVTTRAVRYEKFGTVLEAGLDCQLGITEAGLKKFLTRFVVDIADFENFVAAQAKGIQAEPNEPKVVKTGEKHKVPLSIKAGSDDREVTITFPTHEPKNWQTAWKIIWDMESAQQANDQGFKRTFIGKDGKTKESPGFGRGRDAVLFKIKQAYFKPGQNAEWIQVLEDAHPSELYVPYYFKGTRFYDLRDVGSYVSLSPKEGGAISQTLGKNSRVMAELRDTGVAFKHGNLTRRGEELTLWANFGAANYTYMIEYGFRDDGVIVFRHSPTGYNYFNHFDASHMHGCYWRIGMKVGPDGNNDTNQVYSVRLPSDPKDQGDPTGKLNIKEITKESFHDWSPQEFTRIRVSNPNYSVIPEAKDRPALPISYDLVTQPQGVARHRRFPDEKFTLHDFWITRQDSPEKMYVNLGGYFFTPEGGPNPKLRDLDNKNVVIWHSSSALHTPRSEDGILKGNSTANGQATVFWTTFELRPRNLFLTTPLYRTQQDGPPKVDLKKKIKIVPREIR